LRNYTTQELGINCLKEAWTFKPSANAYAPAAKSTTLPAVAVRDAL
jgi:hypothetical protein